MRTKFTITIFTFLHYFGIAQISNSTVSGIYEVNITTYNCSQLTSQTGILYLSVVSNCIKVKDSSYTTNAVFLPSVYAQVNPDSTFSECSGCCLANGKYFTGDSLHLLIHYQFSSTNYCIHEYFGKRKSFTGIEDLKLLSNLITISPQPANAFLRISFPNDVIKNPPVLYNIEGRQVNCNFVNSGTGNYDAEISEVPSGIYFLMMETTAGTMRKKVTAQH